MDIVDIFRIERHPFSSDILNDDMQDDGGADVRIAHIVRLFLYLTYCRQFCMKVGIPCRISPNWLFLNRKSKRIASMEIEGYMELKQKLNVFLFEDIMGWSSWSFGKMALEDDLICESKSDIEAYIADMEGSWNKLGTCSDAEWRDMVLAIPELCIDSTDSLDYVEIYLCWNKKLASYLNYRNCNRSVVNTTFRKGDELISQILEEIYDPFQSGSGLRYTMLMPDRYLLGFYEGADDNYSLGFRNLHMHFVINIVVLEQLLDNAIQILGIKENEDDL